MVFPESDKRDGSRPMLLHAGYRIFLQRFDRILGPRRRSLYSVRMDKKSGLKNLFITAHINGPSNLGRRADLDRSAMPRTDEARARSGHSGRLHVWRLVHVCQARQNEIECIFGRLPNRARCRFRLSVARVVSLGDCFVCCSTGKTGCDRRDVGLYRENGAGGKAARHYSILSFSRRGVLRAWADRSTMSAP